MAMVMVSVSYPPLVVSGGWGGCAGAVSSRQGGEIGAIWREIGAIWREIGAIWREIGAIVPRSCGRGPFLGLCMCVYVCVYVCVCVCVCVCVYAMLT